MATAPTQFKTKLPKAKTDPTKQYVSGGSLYGVGLRSLPLNKDELTWKVGADVFDRMANDPQISAGTDTIVQRVLGDGVQVSPAKITDKEGEIHPIAQDVADSFAYNLNNLQRPIVRILEEMLRPALRHGCKVAEVTYDEKLLNWKGKKLRKIASIKPKPRNAMGFVVDEYFTLWGFTYRKSNGTFANITSPDSPDLIERRKGVVLTIGMEDEDPRGQSWYRAAYNAWNFKMLNYPAYLKYLLRWAEPSLVGECAENQPDEVDDDGETISPTTVLKNQLLDFANGTVIAIPNGASVDAIESKGKGDVFTMSLSFANKEMRMAILKNELSNADAEHQTKGSTESQEDSIVEPMIWYLKGLLVEMIMSDIAKPYVIINYGEDALQYMPVVSLGDASRKDWEKAGDVIDKLLKNEELYPSQKRFLTGVVGMPEPTKEEIAARMQEKEKMQEQFKNGNKDEPGQSDKENGQGARPTEPDKEAGRRPKP
jgi:hypothetical protein